MALGAAADPSGALLELRFPGAPPLAMPLAPGRELIFGSGAGVDLAIYAPEVAPHHGRFYWERGQLWVQALSPEALNLDRRSVRDAPVHLGSRLRVSGLTLAIAEPGKPVPTPREESGLVESKGAAIQAVAPDPDPTDSLSTPLPPLKPEVAEELPELLASLTLAPDAAEERSLDELARLSFQAVGSGSHSRGKRQPKLAPREDGGCPRCGAPPRPGASKRLDAEVLRSYPDFDLLTCLACELEHAVPEALLSRLHPLARGAVSGAMSELLVRDSRDGGLLRLRVFSLDDPRAFAAWFDERRGKGPRDVGRAGLIHPCAEAIREVHPTDGGCIVASLARPGRVLSELITASRGLPEDAARRIAGQVLGALRASALQQVDDPFLNTQRILIDERHLGLVAWGLGAPLSKAAAGLESPLFPSRGTFADYRFLAPEVIAGPPSSEPATLAFRLGVVLYLALCCAPPWEVDSRRQLQASYQRRESAIPIEERRPYVPATLSRFLTSCLSLDPARRPQSVEDAERLLRGDEGLAHSLMQAGL